MSELSPLERLLREEIPTGSFGGRRLRVAPVSARRARANREALEAALREMARSRRAA